MFPQQSIYRPVEGVGEYFTTGMNGLGAYFKPQYERPIAGLGRAFGADDSTPNTLTVSNKMNAALLIGLGALVIVGGLVFLGPQKKMHANASRKRRHKKKSSKKARSAHLSRVMTGRRGGTKVARVYAEQAGYIKRDLGSGMMSESDIPASLAWTWDDQKDYLRSRGIKTKAQFVKGVRAKL